jgi:HD-GYP domain-containing protein (c-di-GMP phosphodiesterase class II)
MDKASLRSAKEILHLLEQALKEHQLYGSSHPRALAISGRLWTSIATHISNFKSLAYDFEDGQVFFDGVLLADECVLCREVISTIERGRGNRLTLDADFSAEELDRFLELLVEQPADEPDATDAHPNLGASIREASVKGVAIKRMSRRMTKKQSTKRSAGYREALYLRYERAIGDLSNVFDACVLRTPIDPGRAWRTAQWIATVCQEDPEGAVALTAVRNHDEYLCHHSINVALFSTALGSACGLSESDLQELAFSALLHDIGKALVPRELLRKTGALSTEEWKKISLHPEDGARLIVERLGENQAALVVAFEHHIGFDHSGYPQVPTELLQHPFSRLVQIADVYDGMTADRSYRRAKRPSEAVTLMLGELEHSFDPTFVRLFFRLIGIYPIGSIVQLNTGATALVRGVDPTDPTKPHIKLIDGQGSEMTDTSDLKDPQIVEVKEGATALIDLPHALSHD